MAQLTVSSLVPNSSTAVSAAPTASSSNGDYFYNTGKEILLFQNSSSQGGGSAVTVTIAGQGVDNFGGTPSIHNLTVSIPSSSMGLNAVGPFRPAIFNDQNNNVQITYGAAGLYVKVVSVAPQG